MKLITIARLSLLASATLMISSHSLAEEQAIQGQTNAADATTTVDKKPPLNLSNLEIALASQDEKAKARFKYRHPEETLAFFGITPGMTVVEALPGRGWYSKILRPYLGSEGTLIGVDYALDMWPHFGGFATEEFIEKKKKWVETWTADASTWSGSADIAAYQYGNMPEEMVATADVALFIRALHNVARFEGKGEFLSNAIKETFDILKPGGIVGIVQHAALEDRPDAWANGSNGYLKQSALVKAFTEQGFEFVGESHVNSNPKDLANEGDKVWRLPPSLSDSKDDEKKRAEMTAIGESNRMTIKFRKPF